MATDGCGAIDHADLLVTLMSVHGDRILGGDTAVVVLLHSIGVRRWCRFRIAMQPPLHSHLKVR